MKPNREETAWERYESMSSAGQARFIEQAARDARQLRSVCFHNLMVSLARAAAGTVAVRRRRDALNGGS